MIEGEQGSMPCSRIEGYSCDQGQQWSGNLVSLSLLLVQDLGKKLIFAGKPE
jgi:hypothetical protein